MFVSPNTLLFMERERKKKVKQTLRQDSEEIQKHVFLLPTHKEDADLLPHVCTCQHIGSKRFVETM